MGPSKFHFHRHRKPGPLKPREDPAHAASRAARVQAAGGASAFVARVEHQSHETTVRRGSQPPTDVFIPGPGRQRGQRGQRLGPLEEGGARDAEASSGDGAEGDCERATLQPHSGAQKAREKRETRGKHRATRHAPRLTGRTPLRPSAPALTHPHDPPPRARPGQAAVTRAMMRHSHKQRLERTERANRQIRLEKNRRQRREREELAAKEQQRRQQRQRELQQHAREIRVRTVLAPTALLRWCLGLAGAVRRVA